MTETAAPTAVTAPHPAPSLIESRDSLLNLAQFYLVMAGDDWMAPSRKQYWLLKAHELLEQATDAPEPENEPESALKTRHERHLSLFCRCGELADLLGITLRPSSLD